MKPWHYIIHWVLAVLFILVGYVLSISGDPYLGLAIGTMALLPIVDILYSHKGEE